MLPTPVSLLERLRQADDGAAWAEFVHLYTPLLYGWARRTGLSDDEAADLLQDVFAILLGLFLAPLSVMVACSLLGRYGAGLRHAARFYASSPLA